MYQINFVFDKTYSNLDYNTNLARLYTRLDKITDVVTRHKAENRFSFYTKGHNVYFKI